MSARIAGLDLSSRALHLASIPLDIDTGDDCPAVLFRTFDLPRFKPGSSTAQHRSVERARVVRAGVCELVRGDDHPIVSLFCEEPLGARNKATNVLREIYGAVLASIPSHIERASIAPQEWRRVIDPDAGWSKEHAVYRAGIWLSSWDTLGTALNVDEHHAEALLVALAGRHLTWRAVERKGGAAA